MFECQIIVNTINFCVPNIFKISTDSQFIVSFLHTNLNPSIEFELKHLEFKNKQKIENAFCFDV